MNVARAKYMLPLFASYIGTGELHIAFKTHAITRPLSTAYFTRSGQNRNKIDENQ